MQLNIGSVLAHSVPTVSVHLSGIIIDRIIYVVIIILRSIYDIRNTRSQ